MSSERKKRIRNSFTGVDFHSFPWLLKCHRVSWFECKVAQLAPIMLNVKTCEDSFLNQPCDRQQNTHIHTLNSLVSREAAGSTSSPLTTVDPLPDLGEITAEKKNASNSWNIWSHFQIYSPCLLLQSRLFWAYQAEWFCCYCCCCWPYISRAMS